MNIGFVSALSSLSSLTTLPSVVVVRCITVDSDGHLTVDSSAIEGVASLRTAHPKTRFFLGMTNLNEAAFVAIRDNTNGALDTLSSELRSLSITYTDFRGLDVAFSSSSDSTHASAIRNLFLQIYAYYKVSGYSRSVNISLPGIAKTGSWYADYTLFYTRFNTLSLHFEHDASIDAIELAVQVVASSYTVDKIIPCVDGAGYQYAIVGSTITGSSISFSQVTGFLQGTRRYVPEQSYAGFVGYPVAESYQTVILPHVYDYAFETGNLKPHKFLDNAGAVITTPDQVAFAIVMRTNASAIAQIKVGDNATVSIGGTDLVGYLEGIYLGAVSAATLGSNSSIPVTITPASGVDIHIVCMGDARGCGYITLRTSRDLQALYNHWRYDQSFSNFGVYNMDKADNKIWGSI